MNLSGCVGRKLLFKIMHTYKDVYNWLKFVSKLPDRDAFQWFSVQTYLVLGVPGDVWTAFLASSARWAVDDALPQLPWGIYTVLSSYCMRLRCLSSTPQEWVNTNYSGKSYWAGTQNLVEFSFPCFLIKKIKSLSSIYINSFSCVLFFLYFILGVLTPVWVNDGMMICPYF